MSLINDALRRAKDAQQQAPPPPAIELPFRPVEPAQPRARRGLGLLLVGGLAVFALLALLFAWRYAHLGEPAARIAAGVQPSAIVDTMPPSLPIADTAADAATRPIPASVPKDAAPPATDTATNAPLATATNNEATNTTALTPPPPPKLAPLRLQAIIFNPKRPSAMISGKMLFVGDKLGEMRVVAIDKDSATLLGAGQTNVLSLGE